MTLQQAKKVVETLSAQEQAELKAYLEQRLLLSEIQAMLADEPPPTPTPGTMDMDKLERVTDEMWAGMDDDEIDAIMAAINGDFS